MNDIEELRARLSELAGAATERPWNVAARDVGWGRDITDPQYEMSLGFELEGPPEPQLRGQLAKYADAAFIVALVNAWPEIEAALARLTAAEADADRLADYGRTLRKARFALCNMDEPPIRRDEALALHDEALALRIPS